MFALPRRAANAGEGGSGPGRPPGKKRGRKPGTGALHSKKVLREALRSQRMLTLVALQVGLFVIVVFCVVFL